MIKIEKLEEPPILRDNRDNWKNDYLTAKANGNVPNSIKYRYRHPEIKSRIRQETHDKCAYCESKITHTYPGDIEHILPQSVFPELIFEWANLTLGCGECNRRKSNYYNDKEPLINPYSDEPEDHLLPVGSLVFGKPGNNKGRLTEHLLELNRAQLIERRNERLNSLRNLADRYANEEGELKQLLKKELEKEIQNDKEYVFVSRAFLKLCSISKL